MAIMNREDIINILNEYAFDGNISPVIDFMNDLLEQETYKENLDLIFMGIATTQMYGFLSYLTPDERALFFECDYYRCLSYSGNKMPFYNQGQLSFLHELDCNQKVFFSAPTSFGKTSIISEYILNNYELLNNIVFVVPTNSLLEELFEKFSIYNSELKLEYNISTQPAINIGSRNLLFLTPERFMSLSEHSILNKFDLIVMDETYKIVDAHNETISDFVNHRTLRFRKVSDLIAKADAKVVFLSPFTYSLTNSMERFLKKYNIKKIDRKLEYVKREIIKLENSKDVKTYFGEQVKGYRKNDSIGEKVNKIINMLPKENSIIYVANYSTAYDVAMKIENLNEATSKSMRFNAFIKHIKENFLVDARESWIVYDALKKGIGIYIAPLPRYIKKEIIKLYESKELNTLIVTSAFTEGVNTCASNLIFTTLVNGPTTNKLSEIDILNVSGRAGRFAKNTIGRVYCINEEVYNRVSELQKNSDIKLENYNYTMVNSRLDYEVEMIDEEYLNDKQKEKLAAQKERIESLGLDRKDFNISLNVSNEWKIILYEYFLSCNAEELININQKISDVYEQKEGERITALEFIFNDIKKAFLHTEIDVFPHEKYEIGPFDASGKFTWGRLYQIYVSGTPKKIVSNNIKFITGKYAEIAGAKLFSDKNAAMEHFRLKGYSWILKYYNKNLSLNMNAFYSETFKIVSNIIQYKIPFYLTFYVSIFNLFMNKQVLNEFETVSYDINKLVNIFEDGEADEEYDKLLDYGLPLTTVKKMADNNIKIEELKLGTYDRGRFDDYEKLIIEETIKLL